MSGKKYFKIILRNGTLLRSMAIFLLINFVTQVLFPVVSWATLTNGAIQPEVYGHQPVDATDNVGLSTGSFNYTLPITSIPEYPMAIGYSSGSGMDQEASAFGFGFNGFSGAISRNMLGLPDDLQGAKRVYNAENQVMTDVSVGFGGSFGVPLAKSAGVQLGVGAMQTMGYNTYKGFYGGMAVSLGLSVSVGKSLGAGIGLTISDDSRQPGLSGSVGMSVSISAGKKNAAGSGPPDIGLGLSVSLDDGSVYAGGSIGDISYGGKIGKIGKDNFSAVSGSSISLLQPLANVMPTAKSSGISLSLSIPIPPLFAFSIDFESAYSSSSFNNQRIEKYGYGYLYTGNLDKTKREHISDITVEGQDDFNDKMKNNPVYVQRDFFSASGQGLSGSMQFVSEEYGVFSRNYSRDNSWDLQLPLILSHTDRKESFPWNEVTRAERNDDFDILGFLKGDQNKEGDSDFDNTMFIEKQMESFNDPEHNFTARNDNQPATKSKMKLRFRGDMASDFNIGSTSPSDYSPLKYYTIPVGITNTDRKAVFLGFVKDMPMSKPGLHKANDDIFNPNATNTQTIKSSTKIDYFTVKDVTTAYSSTLKDVLINGTPVNKSKFKETIYNHSDLIQHDHNDPNLFGAIPSSDITDLNIIDRLAKDNDFSKDYFQKLVADIRVTKSDGMTYIFNLPVFAKNTKSLQLQGKGICPPVGNGPDDYKSFNGENRIKTAVTDEFSYPYAWLLTGIIGPDYIDFDDIPGPSDGDLGYWVKMKYIRGADEYRWRMPFTAMDHSANALQTFGDDFYSVMSGLKEIYYLDKIESKGFTSKYTYQRRLDGVSAASLWNGDAYNTTKSGQPTYNRNVLGNDWQLAVTKIDLYKKDLNGDQTLWVTPNDYGQKLRTTRFYYDYSTSSNIPNSELTYNGGLLSQLNAMGTDSYYYNPSQNVDINGNPIVSGKLTLTKVQHIGYDETGQAAALPSYQFDYFRGTKPRTPMEGGIFSYNPSYDKELYDVWGNYHEKSKGKDINQINQYAHYTEINKSQADLNSQVFALKSIAMPTGGKMNVEYEAGGYYYVQDKPAYVMRKIYSVNSIGGTAMSNAIVDISDIVTASGMSTTNDLNNVLKKPSIGVEGDRVYAEAAYYQDGANHDLTYHCDAGNIVIKNSDLFVGTARQKDGNYDIKVNDITSLAISSPLYDNRKCQEIVLKSEDPKYTPFFDHCEEFIFKQSDLFISYQQGGNPADAATQTQDSVIDALRKMIMNVVSFFTNLAGTQKDTFISIYHPCDNFYSNFSYLRTPVFKEKYTGGRVKSLTYSDEFQYSSNTIDGKKSNQYKTNYFYDENGNGSGKSTGVATVEPGGGASAVIDVNNVKGVGFMPSPAIIYSKVTVETGYNEPSATATKVPRKKGKTEYYFFTPNYKPDPNDPNDQKLRFADNFKEIGQQSPTNASANFFLYGILAWIKITIDLFFDKITISIPLPLPIFVNWMRKDRYNFNSYSYSDMSDLYGRPYKVVNYAHSNEGVSAPPMPGSPPKSPYTAVSTQKFKYTGPNETVSVLDGDQVNDPYSNVSGQKNIKPGRLDQVWSEAYYSKTSDVSALVFYMGATTKRDFNFTTMKYVHVPQILKEVEVEDKIENRTVITRNTKFDAWTGEPLEVQQIEDGYGNNKITRKVPAYWKYPDMGPAFTNTAPTFNVQSGKLNMLSDLTAVYEYLNAPDNDKLLGVSVTEWAKTDLPHIATWNNELDFSGVNKQNKYSIISGSDISKVYENKQSGVDPNVWSKRVNTGKSFGSSDYISNNRAIYRPVRSYQYKTPILPVNSATGIFTLGTGFVYDNTSPTAYGRYNTGTPQAAEWQLISETTRFDADGDVIESKDPLDRYVANYMGCNFSYNVASVNNSPWAGSLYDGAENQYTITSTKYVDDHRLVLGGNTNVLKADANPSNNYLSQTLNMPDFITGANASVVNVCVTSASPAPNVEFGRINDLSFENPANPGVTLAKRDLILSFDDNRNIRMMSNRGEPFNGYFVFKSVSTSPCISTYKIVFDNRVIKGISSLINLSAGITLNYNPSENSLLNCNAFNKNYLIPINNNLNEAHTGNYLFATKGGIGTKFTLSYNDNYLPAGQFSRKYSAFVWVHDLSASGTKLVLKSSGLNISTATIANPYMVSGHWKLLRADITEPGSMETIEAYVEVVGTGTAFYDDFKVQPTDAQMSAAVYDNVGRVTAKLDEQNLATFYKYDTRGRLIAVKKEIQNVGPTTLKKYLYNDQKKD